MKNKIKSFEDFEKRFKDQTIPVVQNNIELATKITNRNKTPIYLRASFITLFLTIFITASIAAAMQYTGWKFVNSEGEEVFEMKTMTEDEEAPHRKFDEVYAKYRSIKEEIMKSIPEGEFVYFLAADAYEAIGISALTSMFSSGKIESTLQVPDDFKGPLLLTDDLKKGYEFEEGSIYYEHPDLDLDALIALTDEMYREAKENDGLYSVRKGKLTDEIDTVKLTYRKDDKIDYEVIDINLSSVNQRMFTTEDLSGYTLMTEGEIDFLYSKEARKVYFITEGNSGKLLVTVYAGRVRDNPEEKEKVIEELLDIAKSLVK